jgi:L-amino acid N-acyltransferase YncA
MTTTTTVYPLPGYPTVQLTKSGEQITIRPMTPQDKDALLAFFRRIPAEDRYYLKEDVTSPKVIEQWAQRLDYSRALPLLALKGSRIIADGTLHHRRAGARRHIGEVRVVVDPEFRNQGVGRGLLHKLIEIAKDKGIEKLLFEIVADKEGAAQQTAKILGFAPVAALRDHVHDIDGKPHDLIVMELRVEDAVADAPDVF